MRQNIQKGRARGMTDDYQMAKKTLEAEALKTIIMEENGNNTSILDVQHDRNPSTTVHVFQNNSQEEKEENIKTNHINLRVRTQ